MLRVAVHKSELPNPPVLLEKKKTSSPSNLTDAPASLSGLLSSDTGAGGPNMPSGSRLLTKIDWKPTEPVLSLDEMIREYEKAHGELAPALEQVDEQTWNEKTTQFVMDGRVLFEVPLGEMFWLGLFDAIHHRGQLSVYIRPMGGRVPSIYGPSADDPAP